MCRAVLLPFQLLQTRCKPGLEQLPCGRRGPGCSSTSHGGTATSAPRGEWESSSAPPGPSKIGTRSEVQPPDLGMQLACPQEPCLSGPRALETAQNASTCSGKVQIWACRTLILLHTAAGSPARWIRDLLLPQVRAGHPIPVPRSKHAARTVCVTCHSQTPHSRKQATSKLCCSSISGPNEEGERRCSGQLLL